MPPFCFIPIKIQLLTITKCHQDVYTPVVGLICYNMKAITPALLLLLACFGLCYSQQSEEFGNISIKELSDETYSKDTASAIILFDIGSLELEPNSFTGTTLKRHRRIKILKEQAFSEWGNASFITYNAATFKIKGATYNLENGVIRKSELEESSIMRRKHNKELERVSVAFPNVKKGSIIEISYVIRHPDYFSPDWQFQYSVPSRKSEYTLFVPIKNVKYNLRGSLKPTAHEVKYEGTHHYWLFKDIPPFVPEPMMPDADAYTSSVAFSGNTNWEDEYLRLAKSPYFGGVLHLYKPLQKIVDELVAGMTDERQKIRAISDYVKRQVEYNRLHNIYGSNPQELIEKKVGDSGDINLLLGSMLEKAGLKVSMVILSTRGNGTLDQKLPSLRQFNYVVCEVATKEGEVLVDATDKLLPFDMLPSRCNNHLGFLIGTGQFGWIPIQPKYRNKVLLDATVTFDETGGLSGKLKSFKDGYAAYDVRTKYRSGGAANYKINLGSNLWSIENYQIKNVEAIDKPIEETCDVKIDEYVIQANDRIYFNPHLFLRQEANPFVSDSRQYPIDFEDLIDNTVVCTLEIPEGYTVEELPENKAIMLSGNSAKCTFSTTVNGNKIMVMSKLIFNKTFFMPSEYAGLKEFYSKIIAKKAENIVLKKK